MGNGKKVVVSCPVGRDNDWHTAVHIRHNTCTMGWGVSAKVRSAILGDAAIQGVCTLDTNGGICILDMCATLRFHTMFTSTPATVASSLMKKCRGSRVIIMHYDDNRVSCPLRDELHKQRYKPLSAESIVRAKGRGKVVIKGSAYSRDTVPMTSQEVGAIDGKGRVDWKRLWSSSAGKTKLYELVHAAIKDWCHLNCDQSLLSWLGDDKFIYPYVNNADLDMHTLYPFQEADQRVCWSVCLARSRGYTGTIVVHTCDTDMVMQMTASDVGMCPTAVQFRGWWLDVPKLRAKCQDGRSACFWMVVAGGCDYCRSATTWGYPSKGLAENIWTGPIIENTNVLAGLHLGLSQVNVRSHAKRKRVTDQEQEEYARRARHCVRLFACDDPSIGGPVWDASESVSATSACHITRDTASTPSQTTNDDDTCIA
jgi:hypothetical protein